MADFDAPSGPPPPKAPEGWVARWNDQYKEWFYVNTFTKKSQWEKPTEPARSDAASSDLPPPSYTPGSSNTPAPTDTKVNPYNNPHDTESEDAKLARRLQEEEDAKARASSSSPYPYQLPPRDDQAGGSKSRGLLGKLFGGSKTSKPPGYPCGGYGGQYQQQPMYAQQGGYGGYPPQQGYGGYPPQQGYGGYGPPQGGYYGGGYPQQQAYGRPGRTGGGGMGMAGGAALGLGAGLVGGMLLEDAIQDHDQDIYNQGFQNGEMADNGGGDFGGDDDFGGDF